MVCMVSGTSIDLRRCSSFVDPPPHVPKFVTSALLSLSELDICSLSRHVEVLKVMSRMEEYVASIFMYQVVDIDIQTVRVKML